MFARPSVAPPSPDRPASPVGNRCVRWNRGRQWNVQHTQRGGKAKLKALHASCILSSNESIKTIVRTGACHPPPSEGAVRLKWASSSGGAPLLVHLAQSFFPEFDHSG